jgi:plastocyanin
VAAGSVAVAGLAGCIGSGQSDGEYDVGMSTRDFRPEVLEVPPGTTVTWKNTSGTGHTVTAYDDGIPEDAEYFASGDFENQDAANGAWRNGSGGAIYSGATYEHTFEVQGAYRYYCIPHLQTNMVGEIVVDEAATPLE